MSADSSQNPPYPNRAYAWFVVAVLIVAALVAYVDRQVVAIVVDPMKEDLGVGDAQIGWLYGVFAVFYAIAALPIAWLADRKSRRLIIAAGIFFWSLMTMACGLTRSYWNVPPGEDRGRGGGGDPVSGDHLAGRRLFSAGTGAAGAFGLSDRPHHGIGHRLHHRRLCAGTGAGCGAADAAVFR